MLIYLMNKIYGINRSARGVIDEGTSYIHQRRSHHSIALYWVIMYCGWMKAEHLAALHQRLPRGKDVLFEEALVNKFFQVLLETSTVVGLVSFTIMVETIFFRSRGCDGHIGFTLGVLPTAGPLWR